MRLPNPMRAARTPAGALAAALLALAPLSAAAAPPPAPPPPAPVPLAPGNPDPLMAWAEAVAPDAAFRAAVARGVTAAPQVGEAQAAVAEALGVRAEVRAALRPRVEVEVSGQQVISRDFSNDPDNILERSRPERRADAVLAAEQLITDFGASRARLAAAGAQARAARARVAAVAEEAALQAVAAWLALRLGEAQVTLADALIVRHETILAATRERARAGAGAEGDVARVESFLEAARAERARAAAEIERARARWVQALQSAPPAAGDAPDRPSAPALPAGGLDEALAAARASPSVQAAAARIASAERELAAARAARLPRLTTGIDAAKFSLGEDVVDHDVRARLTLRHNLYAGGAQAARIDQAAARLRQGEFLAERTRQEAERLAAEAFANARALDDQSVALRAAYVASRRTRDLYAEQFRLARGSLLELLRAEADLSSAAQIWLDRLAQRDLARYTLLARTGRLLDHLGIEVAEEGAP
jgi:adhesin transport system outer membrane protein